jgi:hypothetical protein
MRLWELPTEVGGRRSGTVLEGNGCGGKGRFDRKGGSGASGGGGSTQETRLSARRRRKSIFMTIRLRAKMSFGEPEMLPSNVTQQLF